MLQAFSTNSGIFWSGAVDETGGSLAQERLAAFQRAGVPWEPAGQHQMAPAGERPCRCGDTFGQKPLRTAYLRHPSAPLRRTATWAWHSASCQVASVRRMSQISRRTRHPRHQPKQLPCWPACAGTFHPCRPVDGVGVHTGCYPFGLVLPNWKLDVLRCFLWRCLHVLDCQARRGALLHSRKLPACWP